MEKPRSFYKRNYKTFKRFEGLLLSNTVLERGLVVATVIMVGNSLKKAVGLSIVFFLLTFFTICITRIIPKSMPTTFQVIIKTMISAGLFIPTAMLVDYIFPNFSLSVGIFMPLLITNSLIVGLSSSRFHAKKFTPMVVDLLSHILGFAIVICLVGAIREILGNASIWDIPIESFPKAPAILLPFSGFIIVGFLAALLQKIKVGVRE